MDDRAPREHRGMSADREVGGERNGSAQNGAHAKSARQASRAHAKGQGRQRTQNAGRGLRAFDFGWGVLALLHLAPAFASNCGQTAAAPALSFQECIFWDTFEGTGSALHQRPPFTVEWDGDS